MGQVIPGAQLFSSPDEATTRKIAMDFIAKQREMLREECVIILLEGDLGAGKTQFVKGIAEGLGIQKNVVSPTYMYMREYAYGKDGAKGMLVHIDAWRVERQSDFDLLKIEQFMKPGNVLCIEWPKEFQLPEINVAIFTVQINELEADRREIEIRSPE